MITWRKSRRSGSGAAGGQECVELAQLPGAIGVRDSKNPDQGRLEVTRTEVTELFDQIRNGHYDLDV